MVFFYAASPAVWCPARWAQALAPPFLIASAIVFSSLVGAAEPRSPLLEIEKMTFVAAHDGENQVRVFADRARFDTSRDVANLYGVRTTISDSEQEIYFEMTCDEGELDLATSDFSAEGKVAGRTQNGLEFEADWLRYDHGKGELYTDAPVLIRESFGTYRGGGFRYNVHKRRFRLHGGASMVQEQ